MAAQQDTQLSRNTGIVRTSIVGIVANILLATFKATVGTLSNSIAIILDAVNNLSDAFSSVITIVGTKLAGRSANAKHPFGYGRIEYLTTIIIGVIVLFAGVESLQESADRILNPQMASYDALALIIVAVAVVAKILLGLYTKKQGTKFGSDSLVASGTDALMDSIISASTLVAAFIFIFTGVSLEAWLGAIISLFIIKAGIDILREALSKVLGERADADLSRKIRSVIESVPGVLGAYDLVLNDYGPDTFLGSVHVEVDAAATASDIDHMSRTISLQVREETGVIIHTIGIYAINTDISTAAGAITARIREITADNPLILQVHGLSVDDATHRVVFDMVISFDAENRRALLEETTAQLEKEFPDYRFFVSLDSDISD